ncbi:MAG: hypothetical protein ABIQ39_09505 [Ilumatobacteraceae bacterium]
MTAIVELVVAGSSAPWEQIGLVVVDGVAQIGGVGLHFDGSAGSGVVSWGLDDFDDALGQIDGLLTHRADPPISPRADPPISPVQHHPLGIVGFDHLVVMTSSLERTCAAIERDTGEPLKRIREAGTVRQGFHRLGEVIVEVVETDKITADQASFWGFVWNVTDIADVCDRLGPDVVSLPRAAVQPGRLIASVRESAGLGLPLALMSPPLRR